MESSGGSLLTQLARGERSRSEPDGHAAAIDTAREADTKCSHSFSVHFRVRCERYDYFKLHLLTHTSQFLGLLIGEAERL